MFFPHSGSKAKKHPKHAKGGRGALPQSHHTQDTVLEEEEEPREYTNFCPRTRIH